MAGPIETLRKAWTLGESATADLAPIGKALSVGQPSGGLGQAWYLNRAGYMRKTREIGDGASSSIVLSCLRVLWDGFAEPPLEEWQESSNGTAETVPTSPASLLIARPNPHMIADLLWQHYIWSVRLDGNAYWFKERSRAGIPVELWPLRSDLVEPKRERGSRNLIDYYEYRPDGSPVRLDPNDVVHLRMGLDPDNYAKGLAPLKVVLREILGDEVAGQFITALLSNMGIPGVVIAPAPGDLGPSPTEADLVRDKWLQKFSGDRRGEPLVLSAPAVVEVVAFSPKDLDMKSLRRLPEERISGVLGVPAIMAGLGAGLESSSGRNESQTLVEGFTERTLIPDWRRVERQLTQQLLPEFERTPSGRWLGFNLDEVRSLQEDRDKVWTRAGAAVRDGWLMVSDAKRLVGLEPLDGDDVYLRSMGTEAIPPGGLPQPTA